MKLMIIIFLLCFSFINNNFKLNANVPLTTDAKSSILIEMNTKEVLHEYNAHEKLEPASITKIVSLKLIFDALNNKVIDLNDKLICSEYAASMGGSQIYLFSGEEMKVHDLIKSVTIASANDAVVCLAEKIAGTEENFVKMMNKEVEKLGLKNTNFVNCTGLPEDNHYTSSYDIAILASDLLINYKEQILKYTSIYEDYIREDTKKFWLVNTNKMVKNIPGVDGLKTGWTNTAGYNVVTTKEENGMRLISVVMGCTSVQNRTKDTVSLLNYGFSNYEIIKLFSKGEVIKTIKKIKMDPEELHIILTNDIYYLKKKSEKFSNVTYVVELEDYKINHYQTENIGKIIINIGDNKIESNLSIDTSIKKNNIFKLMNEIIKNIF